MNILQTYYDSYPDNIPTKRSEVIMFANRDPSKGKRRRRYYHGNGSRNGSTGSQEATNPSASKRSDGLDSASGVLGEDADDSDGIQDLQES